MYVQFNADGTVFNSWTEDGEWWPDDTVIRLEDEDGNELGVGPMRISRYQPDGWEQTAGKRWDPRQKRWVDSGVAPQPREADQAAARLAQMTIGPNPDAATMGAALQEIQRWINGRDPEIKDAARKRRGVVPVAAGSIPIGPEVAPAKGRKS